LTDLWKLADRGERRAIVVGAPENEITVSFETSPDAPEVRPSSGLGLGRHRSSIFYS